MPACLTAYRYFRTLLTLGQVAVTAVSLFGHLITHTDVDEDSYLTFWRFRSIAEFQNEEFPIGDAACLNLIIWWRVATAETIAAIVLYVLNLSFAVYMCLKPSSSKEDDAEEGSEMISGVGVAANNSENDDGANGLSSPPTGGNGIQSPKFNGGRRERKGSGTQLLIFIRALCGILAFICVGMATTIVLTFFFQAWTCEGFFPRDYGYNIGLGGYCLIAATAAHVLDFLLLLAVACFCGDGENRRRHSSRAHVYGNNEVPVGFDENFRHRAQGLNGVSPQELTHIPAPGGEEGERSGGSTRRTNNFYNNPNPNFGGGSPEEYVNPANNYSFSENVYEASYRTNDGEDGRFSVAVGGS